MTNMITECNEYKKKMLYFLSIDKQLFNQKVLIFFFYFSA